MKATTTLLLVLSLLGAAAARELLAPSPTERINAQRKQQQSQQAQASGSECPRGLKRARALVVATMLRLDAHAKITFA